jgi:glycosyltransferase involved in cell wall biosynthesis
MKILYHHRIASKDGQFVHVEELTHALRNLGHEIIMVGPGVVNNGQFGSEGGVVALLKRFVPAFIYELLEFSYSFIAFIKLFMAAVIHRPDCLYERYNLYMPAGIWIRKIFRMPMLLEVNSPLLEERARYHRIALYRLAAWTERYVWRNADAVLPVTQVLAGKIVSTGIDPRNISVIHNGINMERFAAAPDGDEAKRRLGLGDKLVLGFTGFVREWHGLERVVDLIAAHPEEHLHLLIVGDGPAVATIKSRARRQGVEARITVTGIVGRDDIARYVAAFDIALQPDVVAYASPLKLFEYMYMGKAVVAPDKPNIREILTHEKDALLFDADSDNGFREAVQRLCRDEALRERLSREIRKTLEHGAYTWENNARLVTAIAGKCRQRENL